MRRSRWKYRVLVYQGRKKDGRLAFFVRMSTNAKRDAETVADSTHRYFGRFEQVRLLWYSKTMPWNEAVAVRMHVDRLETRKKRIMFEEPARKAGRIM